MLRGKRGTSQSKTNVNLLMLSLMNKRKKPYFHNNWRELKNAPSEFFESIEYDEFMSWKVSGWELPSSCYCIIRVSDLETKHVKEHVFKNHSAAQRMVEKLLGTTGIEFTVVDPYSVKRLIPDEDYEYEDF